MLRIAVDAAVKLRVDELRVGHWKVDVGAVIAALVMLPTGKDRVLRSAVLTHLASQIIEPLATAKSPERLLAEEQRDCIGLVRRCCQRGHCSGLENANLRRRGA